LCGEPGRRQYACPNQNSIFKTDVLCRICGDGGYPTKSVKSLSQQVPRDKVVISGDVNTRVVFVKEKDIRAFTIKAADDHRTLNKICI